MSDFLATMAAGLAVALLVPPGFRRVGLGCPASETAGFWSSRSSGKAEGWWRRPGPAGVLLLAGTVTGLLLVADGTRLMLGLVVVGVAAAASLLLRRSRLASRARRRRAAVVDVCEALAGELRAGQPLVSTLGHGADVWPELVPVVGAARLGADVPAALRRLARTEGAEGLAEVAAAWQVAERSGTGLAVALDRVARTARERQSTRHLVQGELASAQATARLVALLPLASLGMSAGVGGDPWHFLLATPAGIACLGLGALCAFAGLLWIDRIAARVLRP